MGHLILKGDNTIYPGFSLLGESSLAVTLDDTGLNFLKLNFLVLSGTTSVTIASQSIFGGNFNELFQLSELNNALITVTISGSEPFFLGTGSNHSNSGDGVVTDIAATATSPTTIHSSLTLINASATTGGVVISAGATNTSAAGSFDDGASLNANITITYTGLKIEGGLGNDFIENDAKNGIVTDGNGNDTVLLGGPGTKATLGTGLDRVLVGSSNLGTNEAAGNALGDTVKFGSAATAELAVDSGAEAGSTAGTKSIGLTKVLNAADGMEINFKPVTNSHFIFDATNTPAVASATSLAAAENAAINAFASSGVVYFSFHGNEYFIATDSAEAAVSPHDAIVELVGITNIHHADNNFGLVTLHV
jgi:hypothetical protein